MDSAKTRLTDSLQIRLSLAASAVILLLAAVAGTVSFIAANRDASEIQDQQLQIVSHTFGLHGVPLPTQPQTEYRPPNIVAEPLGAGDGWLLRLPADLPDGLHTISVNGEPWRVFVRTPKISRPRFAVAQRTQFVAQIARDTVMSTAIPLLVLAPVLCGLIYGLTQRALKPVTALSQNLDRREPTDLSLVSASGLLREVRPIATAVNGMIGRVRNTLEAQRRFISDAAHELRSPLAVLALQAQNLEVARTPQEMAERLVPLRQGLARTSSLLEQLLALAYARAPSEADRESVLVADALRSVIGKLLPFAERKGIEFDVQNLMPMAVAAREIDLVLILRNALDNAIRYSPAGTRVHVTAFSTRAGVQIEVADQGPGIPEAERERILEPFIRLNGGSESGSGLGLSIVKEVVQRLGGSLALRDARPTAPKGLRMVFTLPAA